MFFPEETELKLFSGTSGGCGFSSGAGGMEQGGVRSEDTPALRGGLAVPGAPGRMLSIVPGCGTGVLAGHEQPQLLSNSPGAPLGPVRGCWDPWTLPFLQRK